MCFSAENCDKTTQKKHFELLYPRNFITFLLYIFFHFHFLSNFSRTIFLGNSKMLHLKMAFSSFSRFSHAPPCSCRCTLTFLSPFESFVVFGPNLVNFPQERQSKASGDGSGAAPKTTMGKGETVFARRRRIEKAGNSRSCQSHCVKKKQKLKHKVNHYHFLTFSSFLLFFLFLSKMQQKEGLFISSTTAEGENV